MKRFAIVACLAGVALFIFGLWNNAPKGWATFREEKAGFEVEYPSNWHIKHYQQTSFAVTNFKRAIRITDGGGLFSSNGTIFQVEVIPTKQISSVRELGGTNARWKTMRLGSFSGEVLRTNVSWQMSLEFIHKGALHRLTCMSETPQQQEQVMDACNRMLLSIRML